MHTNMPENGILVSTDQLAIGYALQGRIRYLQQNLNLRLYEGDMVCLIGPNGCGKSTLIRTLAGIQKSLQGSIHILSYNLAGLNNTVRTKLMSIVLTDKSVVDQITVEEIVSLGRYASTNWIGALTSQDQKKIFSALHAVKLNELKNRTYGMLSDGERQRAFIAKALASDAPVMLLDEPTAHLDILNRVEILTLLKQLSREKGHTVLLSTHELDLALQLADEIWLMTSEGSIHIGTPEEIRYSGLLDKVFGNTMVAFNSDDGVFQVRTKKMGNVEVIGSGEHYQITIKALNRLGLKTNERAAIMAKIVVDRNRLKLYLHGREYNGLNLLQICRLLRCNLEMSKIREFS
jgi:iron complex transport system ATP-binding protein